MLQFSKSKTSDIFVLNSSFYVFLVFLSAKIEESFHVQEPMDTIFNGKGGIIIYISTANHTETIGILQILIVR